MILLDALAIYALVGAAIAPAFLLFGIERVLGDAIPVTIPARCLLFPGAVVLWPVILRRWSRGPQ
jgi:hypothetical protein